MGAPAARVGDLTGHGTPLGPGPGAATVLIGGLPAWRASDVHSCPLVEGQAPHVGGRVGVGSTTVLIGGVPAVRRGDFIVESGPPNIIVDGAANVLIG